MDTATVSEYPIRLATGPLCKNINDVRKLSQWPIIPIIPYGSGTVEELAGNPEPNYHYNRILGSINSRGMKNGGESYHKEHLPEMCDIAQRAGKELAFSMAGDSPEQYARLLEIAICSGVKIGELNTGCPNKWSSDGRQMRVMSYDPRAIQQVLELCANVIGSHKFKLGIKLSPIFDSVLFREVTSVTGESKIVTCIIVVNTLPNCFLYTRKGDSVINPEFSKGLAGMSGRWMKGVGLGHIIQLRALQDEGILPKDIEFIGVGGVGSGSDVVDYLRAGASSVQVGTEVFQYGLPKLLDIYTEYLGYMKLSKLAVPASL